MYKKFAAIGLSAILIAGPVSPAEASVLKNEIAPQQILGPFVPDSLTLRDIQLRNNTIEMQSAIKKLKKHVGKTWYVFSGNTPSGWDCSGLTMWFYEQLGIELEHRASRQESAGVVVTSPKTGDLVVFKYEGSKSGYHVGVYLENGNMIHAPKRGQVTRVQSIDSFGGSYSDVIYVRILETK